ncbi:hypothetical protein CC86DRAFT_458548 [Ophiobolus disseminans]|uniref:Uncharacterized protein n=1 Tax=Ophiobolus disseminans TaxID=1469910 RepID=A0A6A6ZLS7_9PLEO|nr:hypothetical protein CC86DRAFT_458548 [Ophiobolus disseminans]
METTTSNASHTIELCQDVYANHFEFQGTARLVVDIFDSDSDNATIEEAFTRIQEAMGRDPVKLFGLIDVVHSKLVRQRNWATDAAVRFYRAFFMNLDLSFIDDTDFEHGAATGSQIVVQRVIDKCTAELDKDGEWDSPDVRNMLEVVDKAFDVGSNLVTATAASSVVQKMARSEYLIFENNLCVFAEFCLCLLPRINVVAVSGCSQELQEAWDVLQKRKRDSQTPFDPVQVQIIDGLEEVFSLFCADIEPYEAERSFMEDDESFMEAADQPIHHFGGPHGTDEDLFADQRDWSRVDVTRFLNQITNDTKIGASKATQEVAYVAIEKMVNSDVVFSAENLRTLGCFLILVGPVLDGMARPSPSKRLTTLLGSLKANSHEQEPDNVKFV